MTSHVIREIKVSVSPHKEGRHPLYSVVLRTRSSANDQGSTSETLHRYRNFVKLQRKLAAQIPSIMLSCSAQFPAKGTRMPSFLRRRRSLEELRDRATALELWLSEAFFRIVDERDESFGSVHPSTGEITMDGAKRDLLAFVLPASKAAESLATTAPAKAAAEAAIAASMTPPVVPRKDELVPGGKIGREVAANFSSFVIDFDDLALDSSPFASGGGGRIYRGFYNGIDIAAKQVFSQMANTRSDGMTGHGNSYDDTSNAVRGASDSTDMIKSGSFGTFNKGGVSFTTAQQREEFMDEFRTLADLHHPNIVTFYGMAFDSVQKETFLVEELCTGGDLHSFLDRSTLESTPGSGQLKPYLPREQMVSLALQVLGAVKYLHEQGIAHRDLKPANILLTSSGVVKICDLGMARRADEGATRGVGTMSYMPPEAFMDAEADDDEEARLGGKPRNNNNNNNNSSSSSSASLGASSDAADAYSALSWDMYSIGIILWEFWFQCIPWGKKARFTILRLVMKGTRPKWEDSVSTKALAEGVPTSALKPAPGTMEEYHRGAAPQEYRDLAEECWEQRFQDRCTIQEALKRFRDVAAPALGVTRFTAASKQEQKRSSLLSSEFGLESTGNQGTGGLASLSLANASFGTLNNTSSSLVNSQSTTSSMISDLTDGDSFVSSNPLLGNGKTALEELSRGSSWSMASSTTSSTQRTHNRENDDEEEKTLLSLRPLADTPASAPELPNEYIERTKEVLEPLKAALLGGAVKVVKEVVATTVGSGASGSVSSSGSANNNKKKQKEKKKVCVLGMGGVGKTTVASAVIQDETVRRSFDKIAWITVGMEPDQWSLQNSLHFQLAGEHFPGSVKHDDAAFDALRKAAKGSKVLLILDDVWDAKYEKPLNCLDPDNASRVLVTTRIRGLLKNSVEVDVGALSRVEARELLMSAADLLDEEDQSDDDDSHGDGDDSDDGGGESKLQQREAIVMEIIDLCQCLPLLLAIVGGMIAACGQGITRDIIRMIQEGRGALDLEDDQGFDVNTRVIKSSITALVRNSAANKPAKDHVVKVLLFFAVFPEDAVVPASFFNKLAHVIVQDGHQSSRGTDNAEPAVNEAKAKGAPSDAKMRFTVSSCLGMLRKHNLIKGDLSTSSTGGATRTRRRRSVHKAAQATSSGTTPKSGFEAQNHGVSMHDLVRDYVISQFSPRELRALQRNVVEAVLSERSDSSHSTRKRITRMWSGHDDSAVKSTTGSSCKRSSGVEGVGGPGGGFTGSSTTAEAEGDSAAEEAEDASFEMYYKQHLFWHMRGALTVVEGDAGKQGERQQILANFRNPPDSWLEHNDPFVKANVSMALSVESMLQLSQAFEVAGDYGRAARVSWATTFLNLRAPRLLLNRARRDLVYRTASLLERQSKQEQQKGSDYSMQFELMVLGTASVTELGSVRWDKAMTRRESIIGRMPMSTSSGLSESSSSAAREEVDEGRLGGDDAPKNEARYEKKRAKASATYMAAMRPVFTNCCEFPGPTWDELSSQLDSMRENIQLNREAAALTSNPVLASISRDVMPCQIFGQFICASPIAEKWAPEDFDSEACAMRGLRYYSYETSHQILKSNEGGMDNVLGGWIVVPLVLRYGNMAGLALWSDRVMHVQRKVDFLAAIDNSNGANYGKYERYATEPIVCLDAVCTFVLLGQHAIAAAILKGFGFTKDEAGAVRIKAATSVNGLNHRQSKNREKTVCLAVHMLLIVVSPIVAAAEQNIEPSSSSPSSSPSSPSLWEEMKTCALPSPAELAQIERDDFWLRCYSSLTLCNLGARAFMRLGRDEEAKELATIAVSESQQTLKKVVLVDCHAVLGEIAAKRGQVAEAETHFSNAMKEATLSRLPMLELLAAREWKKHLLEPQKRDCSAAEATIDGACAKMKKTRDQLAPVLEGAALPTIAQLDDGSSSGSSSSSSSSAVEQASKESRDEAYERLRAKALVAHSAGIRKIFNGTYKFPGPTWDELSSQLDSMRENIRLNREAAALTSNPILASMGRDIIPCQVFGQSLCASPIAEKWAPEDFDAEACAMRGLRYYSYERSHAFLKSNGGGVDGVLAGWLTQSLSLRYGNWEGLHLWKEKVLVTLRSVNFSGAPAPDHSMYESYSTESVVFLGSVAIFVLFGQCDAARELMAAFGFTRDPDGAARIEAAAALNSRNLAVAKSKQLKVLMLLILTIVEPALSLNQNAESSSLLSSSSSSPSLWEEMKTCALPSPAELARMDRENTLYRCWSNAQASNLGARAFMRLGRDEEAKELATIAVSESQQTLKKVVLVDCHAVLGEIAAKRGQVAEAETHFSNAMKEATLSRLPMLELLAAREWKKHLLEPQKRDCSAAEATIDGACAKMKKTRDQLATVL